MNLVLEHEDSTVHSCERDFCSSAGAEVSQCCPTSGSVVSGEQWSPAAPEAKLPAQTGLENLSQLYGEGRDDFIQINAIEPLMVLQDSNLNSNMNFHCFQGLILGQTLDSSHRCQISLHSVWFLEGSCGYFICISTRDTLFSSVTCKWL